MAVVRLPATPAQRAQADRVRRGKPKTLDHAWRRAAEHWAGQRGLDADRVLDLFDEIASLKLYDGADWDAAQAEAWDETTELLATVGA